MALIKYEVSKNDGKAIFLDGFPRSLDQVGHSLYFKDSLGYRSEPDFFVFINVANSIIDERIKYRVVCPICKAPRNLKLLATRDVGYDAEAKQFYLMCDNPTCGKARMYPKEGDELGIEPIRARIEMDQKIFENMLTLHGIDKVYLRNSVPVDVAKDYVDGYELTPGYDYKLRDDGTVETIENLWTIKDDDGVDSYSLLPAAVCVSLIKQVAGVLGV
jgi:adenylate kinase family enzyme